MTSQKIKDAEKAALQDELKYYSDLLASHYSSVKIHSQHTNVCSTLRRNPTNPNCRTFKTTTNHVNPYRSTSFQSRNVTLVPNQNLKANPNCTLYKKKVLPNKVSNSLNLRKYPCRSSMVKVNPSTISCKSFNHTEKTLNRDELLKKNLQDSKRQMNPGVINKPSSSSSQVLMDEMGLLIKQLKQRTKNIDNKANHMPLKVHSLNKSMCDKPELKATIKVPSDSKIFCNALTNKSQTIDLKNTNYNILCSINSSTSSSSKNSNSCMFNGKKEISERKPPDDVKDSLVKPLIEFENNFLRQSNNEMPQKTSRGLYVKSENVDVLQVNNTIKTTVRKKIIKKCPNSLKKLSKTTLFASKYKVVNRKPCVEHGKVNMVTAEVKTPLKIKPVKKHINSIKKVKSGARLITTKYKIINKNSPCVQSLNSESSCSGKVRDLECKLPFNDKMKLKSNKLNSKYKIVNKHEKSAIMPTSLFVKKSIESKQSKLGCFVNQEKNLKKFNVSNLRKYKYTSSKLYGERKIFKRTALLKESQLNGLNLKTKRLNSSRNSFISHSKYRTVNKQHNSPLKKISGMVKSSNLSNEHSSSMDLDLLMELAAEKKESNDNLFTKYPSKHVLIKRVFKSKNVIVNKNISSLQSKAAKMIKTKYSILNKKHSWQKRSFTKILISPKSYKGHKFNHMPQRKMPFFHNQRNKRNNARRKKQYYTSTYLVRSYSRNYLVSKNRSRGPFQSTFKTPKKFVFNKKIYLKTPNTLKSIVPASKAMAASRALNRSINRVLTASVKKRTSKVNIYCMFYNRFGRCNKGIKCPYVHDPSKIAVCTRFLRGTCKTKNCTFSHEICPGKMAICSFFLLGSCTKTDCPYRHETLSPNAKLCKAFVQGYCPDGKQCKQAHVLVCPQFVQGHCDKGDVCPFPHPPPREKKTIPDSAEKSESVKETEELILEKMSRYFECTNESVNNDKSDVSSLAVTRTRNLPEQPSFIAL